MRTDPPLHAWVDESVLVPEGRYIVAAVVARTDEAVLEQQRGLLRALVRHARPRLHWSAEESRDRAAIAAAIARMPLTSVVVTATRLERTRQERARRKCLEQLLFRLAAQSVEHVWLESRDAVGNERDRELVAALRGKRSIPRALRVDFDRPLHEPLLWLPDAVAGAVAAAHAGDPRYRAALAHLIEEFDIEL